MQKKLLSYFFIFLFPLCVFSQNILNTSITLETSKYGITDLFEQIQTQTGVNIAYNSKIINSKYRYNSSKKEQTLGQILTILTQQTDLTYKATDDQIIILKKKYFEIQGIVRDAETNELLTAATVFSKKFNIGVYTNEYGFFSMKLPEGKHNIYVQYLGKKTVEQEILLHQQSRLNISLPSNENVLAPIIVNRPLQNEDHANTPLNQKAIVQLSENTPNIGGDPDLLHVLRAQAGVQSSAGGIGGLYVRGSNTGHNLVLLDGVPVYNWMHLLGMNSIFNPNTIRGVQFHTSGFSAKYGGRLASVIDIQSREGNPEKWSGMAGINQRSIHAHISGPLGKKKKGSFWVGGRRSLVVPYVKDILTDAFYDNEQSELRPAYFDLNLKFNYTAGLKDRFYLSGYMGNDLILGNNSYSIEGGTQSIENDLFYGNQIFSFRWNHIYNKYLFSNITVNYSRFYNRYFQFVYTDIADVETEFLYEDFRSNNRERSIKADFDLFLENHHIKFGGETNAYKFTPFAAIFDEGMINIDLFSDSGIDSLYQSFTISEQYATHWAAYIEDEIKLSDIFNLRIGFRLSSFKKEDESDVYLNLEPRLLLTAKWSKEWSGSFSATKMVQYLHLISNTDIGLPQDFWIPSNNQYKPETAVQLNADTQYNYKKWRIKGGIFYKQMDNLLAFPDSLSSITLGEDILNQMATGSGNAYGTELSAYAAANKWSVFGAYTLSWANRNFFDINGENSFPFQFDARHYLQLMAHYQLNEHWQIGSRAHFSTPRPQLVSVVGSLGGGLEVIDLNGYGRKNEMRGDFEHRWDLNVIYNLSKGRFNHRFSFELYNTFNKQNPVFYRVNVNENDLISGMSLPFMLSGYYSVTF